MDARIQRWWRRVGGGPTRLLMRVLARGRPRDEYDDILLVVVDLRLVPSAHRFFARTRDALAKARELAPRAYAELRRDICQVLLWGQTRRPPYHPFQMAAVVPPRVASDTEALNYAAWLLYASGLAVSEEEAEARADELLLALTPEDRDKIAEWLAQETARGPPYSGRVD